MTRILNEKELLFTNRAIQTIGVVGTELAVSIDNNDVEYENSQLILDLVYFINALSEPLLDWSSEDINDLIDFYTVQGKMVNMASMPVLPFNDLPVFNYGVWATVAQLNAVAINAEQERARIEALLSAKADLHGDPTKSFKVKDAEVDEDAVNLKQLTEVVVATTEGIEDSIAAPSFVVALAGGKTLGKYVNGDTVPAFATIQEQLKDIAQETINPELIAPTFSVTLSNNAAQEVGSTYSASLVGVFNRGQIKGWIVGGVWDPLYEQDKRAGMPSSYILDGTTQVGSSFVVSRVISLGDNVFNGTVNFEEGPQPYSSLNEFYETPLPAGSLTASTSVYGYFKTFFGVSSNANLNSAQILALANATLSSSKVRNFTNVSAGSGEYVYYCYKSSYGDLTNIILDGSSPILGAFTKLSNVSVTNAFGVVETYIVYRSNATNAFTNNSLNFS